MSCKWEYIPDLFTPTPGCNGSETVSLMLLGVNWSGSVWLGPWKLIIVINLLHENDYRDYCWWGYKAVISWCVQLYAKQGADIPTLRGKKVTVNTMFFSRTTCLLRICTHSWNFCKINGISLYMSFRLGNYPWLFPSCDDIFPLWELLHGHSHLGLQPTAGVILNWPSMLKC